MKAAGEGYGVQGEQKQRKDRRLPPWTLSTVPLLLVIVVNMFLSNPFGWEWGFHWNETALEALMPFNLALLAGSVGKIQAIWSICVALIVSSIAAAIIGRKHYTEGGENFLATINYGAVSSCAAVLNVASGFAFGSVMVKHAGLLSDQRNVARPRRYGGTVDRVRRHDQRHDGHHRLGVGRHDDRAVDARR